MAGRHTIAETERQIDKKLDGVDIDITALTMVSALFRSTLRIRADLERTVLAKYNLSWTALVVLWIVWVWERIESRQIATEGGFSKSTLTGVITTLENRGLLIRTPDETDRRLVQVTLSDLGKKTMDELFPEVNRYEEKLVEGVSKPNLTAATQLVRAIAERAESLGAS